MEIVYFIIIAVLLIAVTALSVVVYTQRRRHNSLGRWASREHFEKVKLQLWLDRLLLLKNNHHFNFDPEEVKKDIQSPE